MSDTCCLCLKVLESSTDKKTRKRLYGASCVPERESLCGILKKKSRHLNLSSFSELEDANAFLCAGCSRLLLRIQRSEEDLAKSCNRVHGHLGLLHANFRLTTAPKKRILSDADEEEEEAVSRVEDTSNPSDAETCTNEDTTSSSPNVIVSLQLI